MPNNIEIRSEEVQEILTRTPQWMLRWGITLIFILIAILLTGSWFFKYPDIIQSNIILTTENPPASIVARKNGRIETIFVTDKQAVAKDNLLGIIENPAKYSDIIFLEKMLTGFSDSRTNEKLMAFQFPKQELTLGDVQTNFAQFSSALSDYQNYLQLNYCNEKTKAIQNQIDLMKTQNRNLLHQQSILKNELQISQKQYIRDSLLFRQNVISASDFEKSESQFLQKKYSFENTNSGLSANAIQISQLEQSILDLKLQDIEQQKKLSTQLKTSFEILLTQIKTWKMNNLLVSPIDGTVTFTKIWNQNQNVNAGDVVFTIVPEAKSKLIGRVQLPVAGSGKVETGQRVNIKFANFPYIEYGMVRGKIESISLVPAESFYTLEVSLPDSLTTNYRKKLPFTQEMSGTAEIITEDYRLLERLIDPIRALLSKK